MKRRSTFISTILAPLVLLSSCIHTGVEDTNTDGFADVMAYTYKDKPVKVVSDENNDYIMETVRHVSHDRKTQMVTVDKFYSLEFRIPDSNNRPSNRNIEDILAHYKTLVASEQGFTAEAKDYTNDGIANAYRIFAPDGTPVVQMSTSTGGSFMDQIIVMDPEKRNIEYRVKISTEKEKPFATIALCRKDIGKIINGCSAIMGDQYE